MTIGLVELFSGLLFWRSPVIGEQMRMEARAFSWSHLTRVLQFHADCAEHSAQLSYVLRPGACRFRNWEFDTTWAINPQGLRADRAASEDAPIVVLGDSYASGWGVRLDESFPAVLENLLGRPILTAAVPSYGTARELLLFNNLPRSSVPEMLVLQYCANDDAENREYVRNDFKLPIMDRDLYEELTKLNMRGAGYSFGKFSMFLGTVLRRWIGLEPSALALEMQERTKQAERASQAADDVYQILAHHGLPNPATKVLVFDSCTRPPGPSAMLQALAEKDSREHGGSSSLIIVNAVRDLEPADDYSYDVHLRPSGHRKIAERLAEAIKSHLPRR